jgi:hypothetical protein
MNTLPKYGTFLLGHPVYLLKTFKQFSHPSDPLCGQNAEIFNVTAGGTYSYHYTSKS